MKTNIHEEQSDVRINKPGLSSPGTSFSQFQDTEKTKFLVSSARPDLQEVQLVPQAGGDVGSQLHQRQLMAVLNALHYEEGGK